jgi:hypothetical protein
MSVRNIRSVAAAAAAALWLPQPGWASCGSAFCTINTGWDVQGTATEAGAMRLDLRYEYINQDRLRSGTRNIPADEDTGEAAELRTVNRNWVATLDYAFDEKWGVSVALPLVTREHAHIVDPTGAASLEQWDFSELSDARVVGRYQFASTSPTPGHAGLQFGLKLPTGDYRLANADGTVAERALQPGTGSTDVVLGAYYSHPSAMHGLGWFVQGSYQRALTTRDGFRPGDQVSLNGGVTFPLTQQTSLLVQMNALHKDRDTGPNAEPDLSGGNHVYASPGVSFAVSKSVQVYGFLQLPVYRNVHGIQLTAQRAVVAGASLRF